MDIRKVNIRKGMTKYEINKNISKWTLLEDDVYLGLYHIIKYGLNMTESFITKKCMKGTILTK